MRTEDPVEIPLRILMLEDVATDAELVEYELRRGKIDCVACRVQTREEFEQSLREFQPSLILADYSLPMFDGLSALALTREHCPDVPFIFVSGAIGEERAIEALKNGATDYVLKDRLSRLVPAVRRTLMEVEERTRRRQAEDSLRAAVQVLAQQAQHLQILHEVDRAVLAAQSPAEIAGAVVKRVREVLPCRRALALLFDFASGRGEVLAVDGEYAGGLRAGSHVPLEELGVLDQHWPGESGAVGDFLAPDGPARLDGPSLAAGVGSFMAIPLLAGKQLIGALHLGAAEPGFTAADRSIARQIADSLAVAIQNARLHQEVAGSREQLQHLSRRLVDVQEEERRHVARELHDEAAQGLTALLVKLSLLERELDCNDGVAAQIADAKRLAGAVLEGLHELAVNLRPVSLDKLGLVPALRQYVEQFRRQYGIRVQMEVVGLDGVRLLPEVEIALYRIVQESLTNVVRHAQATNVAIILERQGGDCSALHMRADGHVHVPTGGVEDMQPGGEPAPSDQRQAARILAIVEDNGVGFDPAGMTEHNRLGLFGMQERAQAVGGKLTVESAPGSGTTLYVEVPCDSHSDR